MDTSDSLSANLLLYIWPFLLLPVPLLLWWGFALLAFLTGGRLKPPSKDQLDKQILSRRKNTVPFHRRFAYSLRDWAGIFRRLSYQWAVLGFIWLPLWFVIGFGLDTLGYGGGVFLAFLLPLLLFVLFQILSLRSA